MCCCYYCLPPATRKPITILPSLKTPAGTTNLNVVVFWAWSGKDRKFFSNFSLSLFPLFPPFSLCLFLWPYIIFWRRCSTIHDLIFSDYSIVYVEEKIWLQQARTNNYSINYRVTNTLLNVEVQGNTRKILWVKQMKNAFSEDGLFVTERKTERQMDRQTDEQTDVRTDLPRSTSRRPIERSFSPSVLTSYLLTQDDGKSKSCLIKIWRRLLAFTKPTITQ